MMSTASRHLDAVFKSIPWQRETLFLVNWLTENNELLEQEDPPLFGSGQEAIFLLADREGILLKKLPLSCDFTLKRHASIPIDDKCDHRSHL